MGVDIDRFTTVEMLATRQNEIGERQKYLHAEYAGKEFPDAVQTEWDDLDVESTAIEARLAHLKEREERLAKHAAKPTDVESGTDLPSRAAPKRGVTRAPEDVYDLTAYRQASSSPQQEARMLRDGIARSVEQSDFPHLGALDEADARAAIMSTVRRLDGPDDEGYGTAPGALSAYLLAVGSPSYRRAFGKWATSLGTAPMDSGEQRAIAQAHGYEQRAFTLSSTGLPVPYQLDPTIIPISNSSVNPFRAISRVEQTTVNEWRGATSAGITAAYAAEATEASDNTPTLAQPTIAAQRAQAFVPFSIESGQDWGQLESEMAREIADAKDDLEATKFTLGSGTNEPFGLIVGATTLVITTTTGAFVVADTYKLEEAVPPRFRPRSSVVGNRFVLNKIRQFDTAGGSGVWLDVPGLAQLLPTGNGAQMPRGMLGYPTFENSAMDAALTTGSEILVMGDFRYFIIVDRVGMSIDLIPHLVGTNHRPTGQRGLYAFWRNGSKVVNAAAFRTLQT